MAALKQLALRKRLGAVLQQRREELKLSQEVVGGKAGVHRTYISDMENGKRNPSLDILVAVAKALRASLSDLLRSAHS